MTTISRVDRPGLVGVAAVTASQTAANHLASPPPGADAGSMQQRHQAYVSQQYALAQYAAQQQFAAREQAMYPDGNVPTLRQLATDAPAPAEDYRAIVAQVRQLVDLHATDVLTDAEFARSVRGAVAR